MTYLELIRDAEYKLEHNEVTFGGYNEMIEPLRREIEQESVLDKIRAEITEEKKVENIPEDVEMWDYIRALDKTLSIVDKHRTESEG